MCGDRGIKASGRREGKKCKRHLASILDMGREEKKKKEKEKMLLACEVMGCEQRACLVGERERESKSGYYSPLCAADLLLKLFFLEGGLKPS